MAMAVAMAVAVAIAVAMAMAGRRRTRTLRWWGSRSRRIIEQEVGSTAVDARKPRRSNENETPLARILYRPFRVLSGNTHNRPEQQPNQASIAVRGLLMAASPALAAVVPLLLLLVEVPGGRGRIASRAPVSLSAIVRSSARRTRPPAAPVAVELSRVFYLVGTNPVPA